MMERMGLVDLRTCLEHLALNNMITLQSEGAGRKSLGSKAGLSTVRLTVDLDELIDAVGLGDKS